jgi:hypothetical protein
MYRTTKGHVMRRLLILAIAAVLAGFAMAPAHAITQGLPDGLLHPNVGAVVADYDGESPGPDIVCSGTLIAPTVFLTVAHCIAFIQSQDLDVWVSFEPTYNEEEANPSGLFAGTAVRNPLFGQGGGVSDTHDVAVILFEESPGITPATLPTAGFLDDQAADHSLQRQAFTTVGYGWTRVDKTGGPNSFVFRDGVRRYAKQTFDSLQPSWLTLSKNPSLDNGGGCWNDSGGPHFFGDVTSNLVVSTTVKGDAWCRSLDKTYRLDTPSARDFLRQFVTLP